jgi:long-chain acyl-CoA synthetase
MSELGFWKMAKKNPDQIAIVDADHTTITFRDLATVTHQVVHGLRNLGLERGDTISLLSSNTIPMLAVTLGATQAGIYVTPVNWHLTPHEVAYIVDDCNAKVFFASESFAENAALVAEKLSFPKERRFAFGHIPGFRPFKDLVEGQPDTPPENREAGEIMTYTAGTTGKPKGVKRALTGQDPDESGAQQGMFLMLFDMQPEDNNVHLVAAPLYHTAVMRFCLFSLHFGHSVVLIDKWTPEGCLERIDKYKVTQSHMVPTMFNRMLQLPEAQRNTYDVSSLRYMIHSAAPCPVQIKKQMLEWWGPVIYEYYAATEGGGTLARPQDWLKKPGTVGNPWPISEVKVFDDDGNELPPREIGTVYMSMMGIKFEYRGDKAKTDKAWRGDFFTVGDAGYLDEDGFLFLCDRKSDMIISGGVNIYPAEIECEMILHPKIGDVAVFGIPHEDWGEEVKAVVELLPGETPSEELVEDIRAFCADRIAKYKMPRTIDFTDKLPREANGKLMKRKLRDPYWEGRERAI